MTTYFDHYAKSSKQYEMIPIDETLEPERVSTDGIIVQEWRKPREDDHV